MKSMYIIITYDGSKFNGYGKQPHKNTIQDKLEDALYKINSNKIVKTFASSRTDTGVHAKILYIQFELNKNITDIKYKLNKILPKEIRVLDVKDMENKNFNVRYDVLSKTYEYLFMMNKTPFFSKYFSQIPKNIDIELMIEASKEFIGEHDFSAFSSAKTDVINKTRKIYSIVFKEDKFMNYDILSIKIKGNGFLYNMVRIIIGTLLSVGEKKVTVIDIKNSLITKKRLPAYKTAIPNGLYLDKIEYKERNE